MREYLINLVKKLTAQSSIVGTEGELEIAKIIYQELKGFDYFKKNPQNLRICDVRNDALRRKNVIAVVRGEKEKTSDTVILIGHMDTVGIEDYGNLKDYALNPDELKEKLLSKNLDEETKRDIYSEDWLFGRGIFDMKAGLAVEIGLLKFITENIKDFRGNIVFLAVADEEGNSKGVLSAVEDLLNLQKEYGFNYIAVLDTDYMAPKFTGDEKKYIYIGTVGKLLPCFYIYGRETHVGQAFEGLDANLLASEILKEVDLSFELSDVVENEASLPPISLALKDLKREYSVQTVNEAYIYLNYSTHISTPDKVMEKLKEKAYKAFNNAINKLNEEYEKYCRAAGLPFKKLPFEAKVLTFDEMYSEVKKETGGRIDEILSKKKKELLEQAVDERIYSLEIVREVHKNWSYKMPSVVLYFSPPYYPHIYVKSEDEKGERLITAIKKAVEKVKLQYDYNFEVKKFYPYISDLSYFALPGEREAIKVLTKNMPGYGEIYSLPVESIQKLNLPVANIGPFGKDAHKFTERLNITYSFEVLPELIELVIKNLFGN
ncbi:M20/M25/M40 family metallo-hydrolase [Thermovenabulum gondwanense]|uniref:Succinyl-diaminopimelate desuccinylase n=1 Tax=Thermovenabulum gondwanense TaxID=520767 RepID=A0A162MDB3_9FIRM|nr:M20/M25/M40 family metallo-hydrolase [Thermovenabulum gondwanense]KYO65364.1 hypothetical protein ATZ99_15980 [Thermovenabulum gondwanense]